MNLQIHLLARIAATALACLLTTATLLLWHSDRQAEIDARNALETLGSQLELQLLKWGATLRLDNPFPDLASWQPDALDIGACAVFQAENPSPPRRFCNGVERPKPAPPADFQALYRLFFTPGKTLSRPIVFHKRHYGTLTIATHAERELAEAWAETANLMTLAALMVGTVCALVYWNIRRALAPSKLIVAGLEKLESGNLGHRLPRFKLNEWRYIAEAVNRLAATQQQLLTERRELAVKLMRLQEDERRDLARELHDEFGQCLAGIGALILAIAQDARAPCPALVAEIEQIGAISQRMLDGIRGLLTRLRPAELEELGLEASLKSLVSGWNTRKRGETVYRLQVDGDCSAVPEAIRLVLFRAAQECLTNIARHAHAKKVSIHLKVEFESALLTVIDDGGATAVPPFSGIGLLGMRERAGALQGRLDLTTAQPHGLIVRLWLPIGSETAA